MNNNTREKFQLARMYKYVNDITKELENNSLDELFSHDMIKHGINMCLAQIGEHAKLLKDINPDVFSNTDIDIKSIVGMRNRIIHSYGGIDYTIISQTLLEDIPKLKQFIEENVNINVLNDPYALYENEYEDYVKEFEAPQEAKIPQEAEKPKEVITPKKKCDPKR